jgi:hypothetical protein
MPRFLVSTFRRLLCVELSPSGDLTSLKTIDDGHGIYFGIQRWGPCILVAERNLDIDDKPCTPNVPQDVIRLYLKGPAGQIWRTPVGYKNNELNDLHQFARDGGWLFVTSAKFPFLFRKSLSLGQIQGVDITSGVPAAYIRENDRNHDAYHVNSVAISGNHLIALAHNWDQPSFALRMSLPEARLGRMILSKRYENLGFCCHDIVPQGDAFWTLDSGGSALVRVDISTGVQKRFEIVAPCDQIRGRKDIPFPRGLDISGDMMVVSYGFNEERASRMNSEAMLAIFDLKQEAFTKHISLGSQGNTCAVLLL